MYQHASCGPAQSRHLNSPHTFELPSPALPASACTSPPARPPPGLPARAAIRPPPAACHDQPLQWAGQCSCGWVRAEILIASAAGGAAASARKTQRAAKTGGLTEAETFALYQQCACCSDASSLTSLNTTAKTPSKPRTLMDGTQRGAAASQHALPAQLHPRLLAGHLQQGVCQGRQLRARARQQVLAKMKWFGMVRCEQAGWSDG